MPILLDTLSTRVLEFWPLAVASARQLEETRRIVEHLQADLALTDGFETATLLASGDGSMLLLVAAWRDQRAADSSGHRWPDGFTRMSTPACYAGVLVPRRHWCASVAPSARRRMLGEAAMMLFTRYAMKPGHSFGALATLSDSNLALAC